MEKQTPREAQRIRIDGFLSEPTKAGLLADEPGVGKTLVAVEVALRFQRTLTVGIKDTFDQFAELMAAQSDGAAVLRRIDSSKPGQAALEDMLAGLPGHYFAGTQYLTRQDWKTVIVYDKDGAPKFKRLVKSGEVVTKKSDLIGPREIPVIETAAVQLNTYKKMPRLDVIIFDEVHAIQNRKSRALRTIKTLKTEYKLGMSGTPYGNKFPGIWAVCRWLWPTTKHADGVTPVVDGSYIRWCATWCLNEEVYVAKDETKSVITGERIPGEFVKTLPFYIRAEAEPLPPSIEVYVDLTPIQRQQYTDLEEELVTWINDNPLVADLPPTLRQRLRTLALGELNVTEDGQVFFADDCNSSKLGALGGILRSYWGGREKALIGMESKTFAYVTYRRMLAAGESVALWTGDTSSVQRAEIKRAFLAGEIQYLVCTIASLSTGVDGFQKVCSKLVWLNELDGDPAANEQFVRRLFRPGRVGQFESIKILARHTKDTNTYGRNLQATLTNRQTLRLAA